MVEAGTLSLIEKKALEARLADVAALEAQVAGVVALCGGLDVLTVRTANERDTAMDGGKQASNVLKVVEVARDGAVRPLNERVKALNAFAKEKLSGPLEDSVSKLKLKIGAFDRAEVLRVAEIEKTAQIERDRIAKETADKLLALDEEKAASRVAIASELKERLTAEIMVKFAPGVSRSRALKRLEAELSGTLAEFDYQVEIEKTALEIKSSIAQAGVLNRSEDAISDVSTKGQSKVWTWDRDNIDLSKVPSEYWMINEALITKSIQKGIREIAGIRIFQDDRIRLG
jgi:hypothetical protein